MKVFFASHSSGVAGAERSLVELARAAEEMGHSGWISIPRSGPIQLLLSGHDRFVVRVQTSPNWVGNRSKSFIGFVRLLQCLLLLPVHLGTLLRLRPDIVIVNSSVSPIFALAARLANVPVAVIVRESIFDNPKLRSVLPPHVRRRLLQRWSRGSVVVVSEFLRKDWPGSFCVWPPIDAKYLEGGTERLRAGTQARVGQALRVAMVGTIDPSKGQHDLLTAAALAKNGGSNLNIWIAGGGTQHDVASLTELAGAFSDGIKLTSEWVDSLEVFRWCDVTVVCSRAEAFGKVTVESLLCGKPVVAYGLGGTVEIASLGGVCLVDPSPLCLGNELARLASPDRASLDELKSKVDPEAVSRKVAHNARLALEACFELALESKCTK